MNLKDILNFVQIDRPFRLVATMLFPLVLITAMACQRGGGPEPKEFPNQSERGKCELRVTSTGGLYCERQQNCRDRCVLYSLPNDKPRSEDEGKNEGQHEDAEHALTPDAKKYYFCRCLEL